MNIFATDEDPVKAAEALDDKRMVRMILESCQMLSTAVRQHCETPDPLVYKPTHVNHPCTIWTRASAENYRWLLTYTRALIERYKRTYARDHKCETLLPVLSQYAALLPDLGLTPFANCARSTERGIDYTHLPVHDAYRQYLKARWKQDKRRPTKEKQPLELAEP
jgi:hypothetical protein